MTYATSKAWTLTSGDGAKTVYAKFKDASENVSSTVSDTITVSGTGVVAPLPDEHPEGCSGGNLFNIMTGKLCVNNAGVQIPWCGNRNTGFSSATGESCLLNRVVTESPVTPPGAAPAPLKHGPYKFGTTTLKNGSKGEAAMELQRFLNAKLNLGLAIDGVIGPKTIAVVKKWQKDHGLADDGKIGPKTKEKMNEEAD